MSDELPSRNWFTTARDEYVREFASYLGIHEYAAAWMKSLQVLGACLRDAGMCAAAGMQGQESAWCSMEVAARYRAALESIAAMDRTHGAHMHSAAEVARAALAGEGETL